MTLVCDVKVCPYLSENGFCTKPIVKINNQAQCMTLVKGVEFAKMVKDEQEKAVADAATCKEDAESEV